MKNRNFLAMACFGICTSFTTVHAQVPPPPISNEQYDLVKQLVNAVNRKDYQRYASIIADDVKVFENGKLISSNRKDWIVRSGINTSGVEYTIKEAYPENDHILTVEYFNSVNSWKKDPPAECCIQYNAVSYFINKNKVVSIYRLTGGGKNIINP